MINQRTISHPFRAFMSAFIVLTFVTPLVAGCGRSADTGSVSSAPAGNYGTVPAPQNAPQQKQGMSNTKKVALLVGAAALAYLYNKHKNSKGTGAQGQYYRSKNGRIYYRDAKGNAVYVTPPQGGIQVPAEEAEMYNSQAGNFSIGDSGRGDSNMGNSRMGGGSMSGGSMSGSNMGNSNMGGSSNFGTSRGNSGAGLPPGPRGM